MSIVTSQYHTVNILHQSNLPIKLSQTAAYVVTAFKITFSAVGTDCT